MIEQFNHYYHDSKYMNKMNLFRFHLHDLSFITFKKIDSIFSFFINTK